MEESYEMAIFSWKTVVGNAFGSYGEEVKKSWLQAGQEMTEG